MSVNSRRRRESLTDVDVFDGARDRVILLNLCHRERREKIARCRDRNNRGRRYSRRRINEARRAWPVAFAARSEALLRMMTAANEDEFFGLFAGLSTTVPSDGVDMTLAQMIAAAESGIRRRDDGVVVLDGNPALTLASLVPTTDGAYPFAREFRGIPVHVVPPVSQWWDAQPVSMRVEDHGIVYDLGNYEPGPAIPWPRSKP